MSRMSTLGCLAVVAAVATASSMAGVLGAAEPAAPKDAATARTPPKTPMPDAVNGTPAPGSGDLSDLAKDKPLVKRDKTKADPATANGRAETVGSDHLARYDLNKDFLMPPAETQAMLDDAHAVKK